MRHASRSVAAGYGIAIRHAHELQLTPRVDLSVVSGSASNLASSDLDWTFPLTGNRIMRPG
jgi:hypothetical protein